MCKYNVWWLYKNKMMILTSQLAQAIKVRDCQKANGTTLTKLLNILAKSSEHKDQKIILNCVLN